MKSILLGIFLLPLISSAGDWDLFPLNQKSFFLYPHYIPNSVEVHVMDSVKPNGPENILYFRRNLNYENAGHCYQALYNNLTYGLNGYNFIDSLVERNDTVFFDSYYSILPFYFLPRASQGQSWIITSDYSGNDYNQITITCSAIQQETFFGITDSVKTFTMQPNGTSAGQTPVNNFVVRLSKQYGLLEFVPFDLFMYHPSNIDFYSVPLLGIDSAGTTHGYHQPTLQDYFHLNVGDVLLWKRTVEPDNAMLPHWQEFYRDTITQVLSSPDSILYYYDRTKLDSGEVITQHNGQVINFRKNNFSDLMSSPPYWISFERGPYLPWMWGTSFGITTWWSNDLLLKTDSLTNDTISEYSFSTDDTGLDTSTCQLPWISDMFRNFTIDTRMGITSYCFYFFGTDCISLTGAVIDGLYYNNVDLPTGINSFSDNTEFSISPNPFHDFAKLEIKNSQIINCELKIYNNLGAIVRFEKKSAGSNQQEIKIDRGDLVDGLYFYQLTSNEFNVSGKFVIE